MTVVERLVLYAINPSKMSAKRSRYLSVCCVDIPVAHFTFYESKGLQVILQFSIQVYCVPLLAVACLDYGRKNTR